MPAGPSEVAVYAVTKPANPLMLPPTLSQAEHGADSQVVRVASNSGDRDEVCSNRSGGWNQAELLRKDIAAKPLEQQAAV